jgi:hypothetical protein
MQCVTQRNPEWTLQLHFYIDPEGRRASGHFQKDCRTFQALRRITENTQAKTVSRGYAQGPRSEVHVPLPPPPPAIANGNQQNQLQIAGPPNTNSGITQTKGAVTMIQKARSPNMSQKLITRQVSMAVLAPPPTIEMTFLECS